MEWMDTSMTSTSFALFCCMSEILSDSATRLSAANPQRVYGSIHEPFQLCKPIASYSHASKYPSPISIGSGNYLYMNMDGHLNFICFVLSVVFV